MVEVAERPYGNRYFIIAVTVVVIAAIMWWLAERLDHEMDRAEKAQFELRLAELRAAVLLREASLVAKNNMAEATQYIGSNPFVLLTTEEGGEVMHYLGELDIPQLSDDRLEQLTGKWFFDTRERVVVYSPRAIEFFEEPTAQAQSSESGPLRLKYGVRGLWSDENGHQQIKGLRLERLESTELNER